MPDHANELSRIRNATRDLGEALERVTRDFNRIRRAVKEAERAGARDHQIERAMQSGVQGKPHLEKRIAEFFKRIAAETDGQGQADP